MTRALSLFASAVPVAAVSCAVIAGVDDDRVLGPATTSATSSTGTGGGGGTGGMGCTHEGYPARPSGATPGGEVDFVAAIREMELGDGPGGENVGLDLDRFCTCQGEGPSCLAPSFAPDPTKACDGPNGIDNAARKAFNIFALAFGSQNFGSVGFTERAATGSWTLLLRVSQYNGEADDEQVTLALYPSTGGIDPLWAGSDVWPVLETSLEPSDAGASVDAPAYVDHNAWIAGGTLVGSLKAANLFLAGDTSQVSIQLTKGVIRARITDENGKPALSDGVIAARWKLSDLFLSISGYRDGQGNPYCTTDLYYSAAKAALCEAVDISSELPSPSDPCDSISLGLGFQAHPALLGGVVAAPPPPANPCPADADPQFDTCD